MVSHMAPLNHLQFPIFASLLSRGIPLGMKWYENLIGYHDYSDQNSQGIVILKKYTVFYKKKKKR